MKFFPTSNHQRFFLLVAVAVLAALFGMWSQYNVHGKNKVSLETATIFPQPRAITPFELTDDAGKPFTLENLKGHYSLIFFGFTHCPDLCPTTLATLNTAYKSLEHTGVKQLPQIIFISVDPEQDTPAVIKNYLTSFNPAFIGATGSKEQLDKLTQEMSVIYAKIADVKDPAHYSIDHSGTIIITNPEGQFYGVFTLPHDATKIAKDMQVLSNSN